MADDVRGPARRHTECEECGAPLVTQRAWQAASPAERAEMAAEGFRRQAIGPTCPEHAPRRSRAKPARQAVGLIGLTDSGIPMTYLRLWDDGSVTWERA